MKRRERKEKGMKERMSSDWSVGSKIALEK